MNLYAENTIKEASLICLQNNVKLSPLTPGHSLSVELEFIAMRENINSIDLIQVYDDDLKEFVANFQDVLEIFVESQRQL